MSLFRRSLRLLTITAVLTLGPLTISTNAITRADQPTATMPVTERAQLRLAIDSGHDYERSSAWVDAVKHYKSALKRWPDQKELTYGLRRAKFQLKIERRYHDESFEIALLTMPENEAIDLFDHIMQRVLTEYTEDRNASTFLAHGTESFYLALDNSVFIDSHLKRVPAEKLSAMQKWLRTHYWNRQVDGTRGAKAELQRIADQANSYLGLDPAVVIMEYTFGGCNSLDDYSAFLTPDQLDDLYGDIEGEFVGLGIEMKAEKNRGLLLVDVLEGSPAQEGGMLPGDYIVAIDGIDVRDMKIDESSRMLRGPKNSRVRITLEDPVTEQTRTNVFSRRPVQIKSFPIVRMIDEENGVGYIKMSGFQRSSADELDAALRELHARGMKSLVWDLRGNPGGLLYASVEVLDRFIDRGVLVETRGKQPDQNRKHRAGRVPTWNIPLAVLIDENSASASEIVAGAIRDHNRGTLVGRHSYGKWSVQSILNTPYSTGLRVTTAKFYSPAGKNYQGKGVNPDITVELPEQAEHLAYRGRRDIARDRDVRAAIETLTKR